MPIPVLYRVLPPTTTALKADQNQRRKSTRQPLLLSSPFLCTSYGTAVSDVAPLAAVWGFSGSDPCGRWERGCPIGREAGRAEPRRAAVICECAEDKIEKEVRVTRTDEYLSQAALTPPQLCWHPGDRGLSPVPCTHSRSDRHGRRDARSSGSSHIFVISSANATQTFIHNHLLVLEPKPHLHFASCYRKMWMCESNAELSTCATKLQGDSSEEHFVFPRLLFSALCLSSPSVAPEVLSVQQRRGVHVMKSGKVTSSEAAVVSINPRLSFQARSFHVPYRS